MDRREFKSFRNLEYFMSVDGSSLDHCSECGNQEILKDEDAGEYVCGRCGLVIGELVSTEPEWRAFNLEQRQRRTRVGAPSTEKYHDRGMTTVIDYKDFDYLGRRISSEQRSQMYRLRKWDRRSKISGPRDRNLAHALSEIDKISSKLNLPNRVVEQACIIYRDLLEKNAIRGRTVENLAAASVHAATRIDPDHKVERPVSEIVKVSRGTEKEVNRGYRHILWTLKIKPVRKKISRSVDRFSDKLKIPEYQKRIATNIAIHLEIMKSRRIKDLDMISGRDHSSITAALMYISGMLANNVRPGHNTQRDQERIARSLDVTTVTLRNRYGEMSEKVFDLEHLEYERRISWERMGFIMGVVSERQKKDTNVHIKVLESEFAEKYNSQLPGKYLDILVDIRALNRTTEGGDDLYNLGFMVA
jgi:transcription initiation factor TFIIB